MDHTHSAPQSSGAPGAAVSPSPTPRQTGRRVLVNAGSLTGSNLWRIVVSFVLVVAVTRRLGVAGVGQYTIALTYLNVCQVLSELGLQTLLVRDLAQMAAQRRSYFFAALRLQVGASLFIWLALIMLTQLWTFSAETSVALWLVGASLPLYAVTSACQTLFQAGERMELVMGVEVFINTLILALSLGVLWWGGSVVQLVGVMIVTQAISAGACLLLLARSGLVSTSEIITYFRGDGEHRDVLAQSQRQGAQSTQVTEVEKTISVWELVGQAGPFYGLALADVLLQRLDILLLSLLTNEAVVGVYSLGYNVVRVLLKLIQSYWRALYPTLARLRHQTETQYARLSLLSVRYGLIVLVGAAAVGSGVADAILRLIYGEEAGAAVSVLRILIWSAPVYLVEMFAIMRLMIEHRPQESLLMMGVHLVILSIGLPLLLHPWNETGAALALLLATVVGTIVGGWRIGKADAARLGGRWSSLLLVLLAATAVALGSAFLLPLSWLARGTVAFFLYAVILLGLGGIARDDLLTFRHVVGRL